MSDLYGLQSQLAGIRARVDALAPSAPAPSHYAVPQYTPVTLSAADEATQDALLCRDRALGLDRYSARKNATVAVGYGRKRKIIATPATHSAAKNASLDTHTFGSGIDLVPRSAVEDAMLTSVRTANWTVVEDVLDEIQQHGKPVLTSDDRDSAADATSNALVVSTRFVDGAAAQVWIAHEREAKAQVWLTDIGYDAELDYIADLDPHLDSNEMDRSLQIVEDWRAHADLIREGVVDPTPLPEPEALRNTGRVRRAFVQPSGEGRELPQPDFSAERWASYTATLLTRPRGRSGSPQHCGPLSVSFPDAQSFPLSRLWGREALVAQLAIRVAQRRHRGKAYRLGHSLQRNLAPRSAGALRQHDIPRSHDHRDLALTARRDRLVTDFPVRGAFATVGDPDLVGGIWAMRLIAQGRKAGVLLGWTPIGPTPARRHPAVLAQGGGIPTRTLHQRMVAFGLMRDIERRWQRFYGIAIRALYRAGQPAPRGLEVNYGAACDHLDALEVHAINLLAQ